MRYFYVIFESAYDISFSHCIECENFPSVKDVEGILFRSTPIAVHKINCISEITKDDYDRIQAQMQQDYEIKNNIN